MDKIVTVPYEDYKKLLKDSSDKENIVQLLNTKFPDDTCQIIAVKSILGIEIEEEPTDPSTPSAP